MLCVPLIFQQTDDTTRSGQPPREIVGGLESYRVHQKPSKKLRLPKKLREVSGLASTQSGRLFGHDDEKGVIYEIDTDNGKILKEWLVGSGPLRGDFEDIAIAGEYFYLVASDGTLIRFPEGSADQRVSYRRIDTGLDGVCEVEGLEYDGARGSLLLACKTVYKKKLKGDLEGLRSEYTAVSNVRGRGLLIAFDLPDRDTRNWVRQRCWDAGLATLPCGPRSLRFRPPLIFTDAEVDQVIRVLRSVLSQLAEKLSETGIPGPGRETPG